MSATGCPPWCARSGQHHVQSRPSACDDGIEVRVVDGMSREPVVRLAYAGEVADAPALVTVPPLAAADVLAPVLARLSHPQLTPAITTAARAVRHERWLR